jgi:hypothetical protein
MHESGGTWGYFGGHLNETGGTFWSQGSVAHTPVAGVVSNSVAPASARRSSYRGATRQSSQSGPSRLSRSKDLAAGPDALIDRLLSHKWQFS